MPISLQAQWRLPHSESIPKLLLAWLTDAGSLTEKLKALPGDFQVQVLAETEAFADEHEYQAMSLAKQPVIIREVLLYCAAVPLVYARSIIPIPPENTPMELTQLGNKPLGELLFNRHDIELGPIEIAEFAHNASVSQLNQQLHGNNARIWGRRRCFHLPEQAILVAEVFLSKAPCYA